MCRTTSLQPAFSDLKSQPPTPAYNAATTQHQAGKSSHIKRLAVLVHCSVLVRLVAQRLMRGVHANEQGTFATFRCRLQGQQGTYGSRVFEDMGQICQAAAGGGMVSTRECLSDAKHCKSSLAESLIRAGVMVSQGFDETDSAAYSITTFDGSRLQNGAVLRTKLARSLKKVLCCHSMLSGELTCVPVGLGGEDAVGCQVSHHFPLSKSSGIISAHGSAVDAMCAQISNHCQLPDLSCRIRAVRRAVDPVSA